jgi:hypothetical protein
VDLVTGNFFLAGLAGVRFVLYLNTHTHFRTPPVRSETGFGILREFMSRIDLQNFKNLRNKFQPIFLIPSPSPGNSTYMVEIFCEFAKVNP